MLWEFPASPPAFASRTTGSPAWLPGSAGAERCSANSLLHPGRHSLSWRPSYCAGQTLALARLSGHLCSKNRVDAGVWRNLRRKRSWRYAAICSGFILLYLPLPSRSQISTACCILSHSPGPLPISLPMRMAMSTLTERFSCSTSETVRRDTPRRHKVRCELGLRHPQFRQDVIALHGAGMRRPAIWVALYCGGLFHQW